MIEKQGSGVTGRAGWNPGRETERKTITMTEQIHEARQHLFAERYRVSSWLHATNILSSLIQDHTFCTLWLDDHTESFNTLLLAMQEKFLWVDVPLNFPQNVCPESSVTIIARLDGLLSGFRSNIVRMEKEVVVIRHPDALYQLQRRQLYRVPPTVQDPDQVEVYRQGAQMITGRMQDISAGGLRILSRRPKDFPFLPGEQIPQIIFGIRDSAPLHMPAIVRFVDAYAADVSGVILGVAFQDPPAADQEKVAQYVQTRDREILRLLSIGLRSSAKAEPASWKGRIKRWWET